MKNNYNLRFTTDANEWNSLFFKVEHSDMIQSWAYGQAKQSDGWQVRRAIFECDGEPIAICQILDKGFAGIRLASRINRGPLFLTASPSKEDMLGVYSCLRNQWRYLKGGVLLLAPGFEENQESYQMMEKLGFRDRGASGWWSGYLDLKQDEAQLRKNLESKWRTKLNASERFGLTMTVSTAREDIFWLFDRHQENMQAKKFTWPTVKFLQGFYAIDPENFYLFRAYFADEPVCGILVYRLSPSNADYYIVWTGEEGKKKRANNFLLWNAALEMKRLGCQRFDLGGYGSADKFGHFKLGMRAIEYRLSKEWFAF